MSPESISPEQLAEAYWENYVRRRAIDEAHEPPPFDAAAGDRILVEGDGFRVVSQPRRDGEPDRPETGLEWAWAMVNCIATAEDWDDYDAPEEGREPRIAPTIERLDLLELLAERAPDDDSLGFLGADALEDYLGVSPDVDAVERAAQRSKRFRTALAGVWYDDNLTPEEIARLKHRASES